MGGIFSIQSISQGSPSKFLRSTPSFLPLTHIFWWCEKQEEKKPFSPSCKRQKKKEVNTCRSSWLCVCSPWLHEMLAETPSCDCSCLNSPLGEQCTEFQHLTPKINYSGSRIGFKSTCTFRARSRLFFFIFLFSFLDHSELWDWAKMHKCSYSPKGVRI